MAPGVFQDEIGAVAGDPKMRLDEDWRRKYVWVPLAIGITTGVITSSMGFEVWVAPIVGVVPLSVWLLFLWKAGKV